MRVLRRVAQRGGTVMVGIETRQDDGGQGIAEESISRLVGCFYQKVRRDPEIGPIFSEAVENWDAHLALLTDFWSTVLRGTARYRGNPLLAHFPLELTDAHFRRWLELFRETAREVLRPEQAEFVAGKAEKIAANIRGMIAARDHQAEEYVSGVEDRREL